LGFPSTGKDFRSLEEDFLPKKTSLRKRCSCNVYLDLKIVDGVVLGQNVVALPEHGGYGAALMMEVAIPISVCVSHVTLQEWDWDSKYRTSDYVLQQSSVW
jgi:hypothetical protein